MSPRRIASLLLLAPLLLGCATSAPAQPAAAAQPAGTDPAAAAQPAGAEAATPDAPPDKPCLYNRMSGNWERCLVKVGWQCAEYGERCEKGK
jgi:hypothetical protein